MPDLPQYDDIHADRLQALNDKAVADDGDYVLYWMQHGQRAEWNHALEYAVRRANALDLGVVVGFGLYDDYPDGNARHFQFMLQGLLEVKHALSERNIKFVMRLGEPDRVALDLAERAALVVCDRGYLRLHRRWRRRVAEASPVRVIQVESELVVPVEVAKDEQAYNARSLRGTLLEKYEAYLKRPVHRHVQKSSLSLTIDKLDFSSVAAVMKQLSIDRSVAPVAEFTGGTSAAKKRFRAFMRDHLTAYDEHRSEPHTEHVSFMGMYLHLGQISPCYLLDEISSSHSTENKESFIEEVLVRRELTHNFVFYNKEYDSFQCLPDWAAETLEAHKDDERPHIYTRAELERGETDDPYWNAAMRQMRERGYLHNHMRMYWGKQLLKWTNTPSYAYRTALYLNNKYFLDGRDANSFANIAWLFGLHDRAWKERDIYGKVRIMTQDGLERKTDPEKFVDKVDGGT